jgi:hypothetical protein
MMEQERALAGRKPAAKWPFVDGRVLARNQTSRQDRGFDAMAPALGPIFPSENLLVFRG